MAEPHPRPIEHPSAWTSAELGSLDAIRVSWGRRHIDALEEACEGVAAAGLALDRIERRHFPLPAIADDLRALYEEILWGRGIALVDRLPVEDWPLEKTEIAYWGVGTHLGEARSQSTMGDRLGRVADVGGKDHKERAYRNSLPLTLHTDACDILGMLSIRKAASGGESLYASALAVHNAILAEKPEHLAPLYRGFRYHRFGEERPGEPPVTAHRVPVLSERDGRVTCRYVAGYIHMAYEELGEEMPDEERDALACFDDVALRPEVKLEFAMEPGWMLFATTTPRSTPAPASTTNPGRTRPSAAPPLAHGARGRPPAHRPGDRDLRVRRHRVPGPIRPRYRGDATDVLKSGVLKY